MALTLVPDAPPAQVIVLTCQKCLRTYQAVIEPVVTYTDGKGVIEMNLTAHHRCPPPRSMPLAA
jgi:hypothetical protein